MASLSYLQPYIEEIHTKAEQLDVLTPVVDALRDILHSTYLSSHCIIRIECTSLALNQPTSSHRAIRPSEMINALAHHSKGRQNALFSSREHQDAQELFQLVSEAIKSESSAVYVEGLRDRGLGGLAPLRPGESSSSGSASAQGVGKESELSRGVFDGLTANRRSCLECGYTEAVMHFPFDSWQLSVPRQVRSPFVALETIQSLLNCINLFRRCVLSFESLFSLALRAIACLPFGGLFGRLYAARSPH